MRAYLLIAVLVAGCSKSDDKTAQHFCQNVRIIFSEVAGGELHKARRGLGDSGRCSDVNEASRSLQSIILAFKAAAAPFRERTEVTRTLDELDKPQLDEVSGVRCFEPDRVPADQIAPLQQRIDNVAAKLAAIAATCR